MANTRIPSVLWNVDQTEVLSPDNKTQARANIDAASTGAVETVQTNLNNHKHKVQFNSESPIELTCNNNTATPLNHSHGNITTDGKVTANAAAIGNKDTLLIVDYDDNSIVKKTTIEFDGSTTTEALTKAGTWASFNNYTHPDGSAASKTGVPTGDVTLTFGGSFKVNQISTDSKSHVSAVNERTITMPSLGTTSTTAAAGNHGHGAITSDGKIGTAADKLVVTGTNGALTTGGTASDLAHDSNYVHTDNNFTNTLKTKLDNVTTVQKVSDATPNNLKTLKISTSDQSVSGILQDDSSVPLGYVVPLTDDAAPGSVLRLDDSKYLEWSFTTAIPEPPQDSSSQYKLLTLDYQGNKLVPKWTTWRQATEPRELRPVSSGIQIPFTSTGNILSDGDTPIYVKDQTHGTYDYFSFAHQQGSSYYEYYQLSRYGNNANVNFIIVNSDETVTPKTVELQGRLTAGSGIAIDSDNTIMCTGSGQVVDGIYKQTTVGNETTTIRFNINQENNPYLDLIKQNNVTSEMLGATYIDEESVQSHSIKVTAKGKNYIGKFWASEADTVPQQETPNASSSIRQLSTALHSVYDGTLSDIPGSQEVPIDRVTLYGNTSHSYDDNNLGNLTVGTLAMRIIYASNTNPSHQLLASCVKGEIDLINVNKSEELYTLTSDSASSYIGVATNDCMLMVTTKPRKCTDTVARAKQAGDSDLGSIVMFPSKAYIDDHIETLDDICVKKSFVSTAHVRLKTDTTYSNGNTSIKSTTLTVAGNGTGTYDLQPIASKADRNGLISITITSLSPGKKCIISVIGHASGESGFNTLLRFGGESDSALELYSYSATIPVIFAWSTSGGSFNISINNKESSAVKYLIQVTAISGPCDYYP